MIFQLMFIKGGPMTIVKDVLLTIATIWMVRQAYLNLRDLFLPDERRIVGLVLWTWIPAVVLVMAYCVMGRIKSGGDPYYTAPWSLSVYGVLCLISTALATIPRLAVWIIGFLRS